MGDENCVIFDTEEENKFTYTDVHNEYQTLVDSLLVDHLASLGMNPEQFYEAVTHPGHAKYSKIVQEHVLGLQDFMVFKKQMVKRNMELENLALKQLQKDTQNKEKRCPLPPASETKNLD